MAVPSSQNPSGKGTSVLPRCDPAGSAVDMITGLTEGNQPCKRDFLSSSVYPQDLWSPLMPNMLLSSRVNQASPFFPAHRTALSHPCASLPMLLCWKEPKFSSLDVGRSVWVIYYSSCCSSAPKTAPQSPAPTGARGWTRGTEKTGSSLKPSPFALQSLFPCKIWHLTLTRIHCGPAHINCC